MEEAISRGSRQNWKLRLLAILKGINIKLKTMKVIIVILVSLSIVVDLFGQANDAACRNGSYDIVKPFIGEWEEYTITDSVEIYIGRLSTHLSLDGCILSQSFDAPGLNFAYKSQGFVNPSSGVWEETYIFNNGGYSRFLWVVDGASIYTLRVGGSRVTNNLHRLLYTDIKKDEYVVIQQESIDGGKTWVSKDSTRIKRIK